METTAFGKVRLVAGFVLRFLSNPNTYLVVGALIFTASLHERIVVTEAVARNYGYWFTWRLERLLDAEEWIDSAADAKPALVLFGGMYAICRISRAIENLKTPTESKAPNPE
jgi:hypothetical protein